MKKFDYNAYSSWHSKSMPEKLHFLVDSMEIKLFLDEFCSFSNKEDIRSHTRSESSCVTQFDPLTIDKFNRKIREFQSESSIFSFFRACDSDFNDLVSFLEFIICRGSHDMNGNPHDQDEYEFRASMLISDIEKILATDPLSLNVFELDENGIIIDK